MGGEYQKYTVKMSMEVSDYRLWKNVTGDCVCVVESYKSKRSIYFAVSNLLSSSGLLTDYGKEYHLMLMGADEGELIYKDFGAFYINQRGEGSFFKKFDGPQLSCYTHCLFLVVENASGKTETLFSGKMPFEEKEEIENFNENFNIEWKEIFDRCAGENGVDAFSAEKDETGAVWYRMEEANIPEPLSAGEALIKKYHHYIIGKNGEERFVGVPGRFLMSEQPDGGETFGLWQPMRGGENFSDSFRS